MGTEHTHHSEHSSHHSDGGSHHHSHHSSKRSMLESQKALSTARKAIKACILMNAIYLIAEAGIGLHTGSLSLVADAGYNLGDLLVLTLALYAIKLRITPSYQSITENYRRYSVLSLTVNTTILLLMAGVISILAISHLHNEWHHGGQGLTMVITAGAGILINGITTWILYKNQSRSSGVRNAFINMAADTFVSVVVVIAGLVLMCAPTNHLADPVAALIACVVIVVFTIKLLYTYVRRSFRMAPGRISIDQVVHAIRSAEHVKSYRHINILSNHSDDVEVTAHVSLDDLSAEQAVKMEIKENLRRLGVQIVTLSFKQHKAAE